MRNRILELATDLFMRQGYKQTSTRQIAKILNITQPALYFHYRNKEDLYVEVILNFAEQIGEEFRTILDKDESVEGTLLDMATVLKVKHPLNFLMMLHDLKHELSPDAQQKIYRVWLDNFYQPFDMVFERMAPQLVEGYQASDVTKHFLRVIQSYVSNEEQYLYETPLELKQIIDIFIRGVMNN